jgi:repressor of nif and glnA expression
MNGGNDMTDSRNTALENAPEGASAALAVLAEAGGRGMGTKVVHYSLNRAEQRFSVYKARKALLWLEGRGLVENRSMSGNRASWSFVTDERRAELEKMAARRTVRTTIQEKLREYGIESEPRGGGLLVSLEDAGRITEVLDVVRGNEAALGIGGDDA